MNDEMTIEFLDWLLEGAALAQDGESIMQDIWKLCGAIDESFEPTPRQNTSKRCLRELERLSRTGWERIKDKPLNKKRRMTPVD